MRENEYQMIVALVNQGYSEDVMAAARPAGAAGGTVLHSRRIGAEETLRQWGFSIQQEKEAVLILARKEEKLAIILGTEGDGLATETIADCDYTVKIPMTHGVDSLNVAAASAVAFWQLAGAI